MKQLLSIITIALIFASSMYAQDSTIVETEFKVFGNCGMCKSRIEKAVKIDEVKYAKWNKDSKMLKIAYESTVSADSLHKRITAVGHDTELMKADDKVYKKLPKCCLYRDNKTTH